MSNAVVISRVYPTRIKAVEALLAAALGGRDRAAVLRELAEELDSVGPLYGRASTAGVYAAFAQLMRIAALLVQWRNAVLSAEADADRFLRAAKAQHKLWMTEYEKTSSVRNLSAASVQIPLATTIDDVDAICRRIAATPLPIGIFAEEAPDYSHIGGTREEAVEKPEPSELSVAFLQFSVDGEQVDHVHHLAPGEMHDLEVEVRVSRWPEGAEQLELLALSIEPKSVYEFPDFRFSRPEGRAPFVLRQRGRAVLKIAQALQARPFEFRYSAAFKPTSAEQPISVVGQRTLTIEALDISKSPITGYRAVDTAIVDIRNQIRRLGIIPTEDIENTLILVGRLGNVAGRALQDALFNKIESEKAFQMELRNELRRDPRIGSELDEHAKAGGGFTDLSFRGIRLELKYEKDSPLSLSDCERYVEQTLSYVVGTGKRVGVLAVLDNSPKQSAPMPAEDGIGLMIKPSDKGSVCVVTVLIQGNLSRPSDLSR